MEKKEGRVKVREKGRDKKGKGKRRGMYMSRRGRRLVLKELAMEEKRRRERWA